MKLFMVVALLFSAEISAQEASGQAQLTQIQAAGTIAGAAQAVRVLAPQAGERITGSAFTVRYQIVQPGSTAEPSPTYRLQMDAADPVETLASEYNFTGLAPGAHTFVLDLVDANHTPIAGSHAEVKFLVVQNPPPAG